MIQVIFLCNFQEKNIQGDKKRSAWLLVLKKNIKNPKYLYWLITDFG